MKLLDLKYLLVKRDDGKVEGFVSFMPTYEDGYLVIYCYEIHLGEELRGYAFSPTPSPTVHLLWSRMLCMKDTNRGAGLDWGKRSCSIL